MIAASLNLMGIKLSDLINPLNALVEPVLPTVEEVLPVATVLKRVNMDLWNDIQAVQNGILKATVHELSNKHGLSTTIVINYKKRGLKCIKCGDIKVFNIESFKNAAKKYVSEEEFRCQFLCKKCRIVES
jgi:hypothetical protein